MINRTYLYVTVDDVRRRMTRQLSEDEVGVCAVLIDDAAELVTTVAPNAKHAAMTIVICRMVIRALGDGQASGVPIGATQGSMSGLGYSQSWTVSGGSTGELYLSKTDRQLLGLGNAIGSYSPVQELAPCSDRSRRPSHDW